MQCHFIRQYLWPLPLALSLFNCFSAITFLSPCVNICALFRFILYCLYLTLGLSSYQTGWSWTRGGPSRLRAGCSGVSECPALNFPRPSFPSWPPLQLRPCTAPVPPASRPATDNRQIQNQVEIVPWYLKWTLICTATPWKEDLLNKVK